MVVILRIHRGLLQSNSSSLCHRLYQSDRDGAKSSLTLSISSGEDHNVACRLAPCLEERQCRKNPTKQKNRPKAVTGNWQIEKAAGHFPPPKTAPRPPG